MLTPSVPPQFQGPTTIEFWVYPAALCTFIASAHAQMSVYQSKYVCFECLESDKLRNSRKKWFCGMKIWQIKCPRWRMNGNSLVEMRFARFYFISKFFLLSPKRFEKCKQWTRRRRRYLTASVSLADDLLTSIHFTHNKHLIQLIMDHIELNCLFPPLTWKLFF